MKKQITLTIIGTVFLLALAGVVSADSYELYCLADGEVLDLGALCNPNMKPRVGPLNICMHLLDNGKICPTNLNTCNSLGLSCTTNQMNTTVDSKPPELTITSPVEGGVYSSRTVFLEFSVDEPSDIYYLDNINGKERWTRVCTNCMYYAKSRGFSEGLNDLTFRARDKSDNTVYYNLTFRKDSKKPKIRKTEPKKGFASGEFYVQFDELNAKNLTIYYGNSMQAHEVDLDIECALDDRGRYYDCNTNIDLSPYDGQIITYYAELTDIADNIAQSRPTQLQVDYTPPVINSFNLIVQGKYAFFTLDITEQNFDEATYIDHLASKPKEKTICAAITAANICDKKVSFKDGNHDVTIYVKDQAGNIVNTSALFFTDSKKPKIKKTEPRRGFASGTFDIKFKEQNPESLVLYYGNPVVGERTHEVDIGTECPELRNDYMCTTEIDLVDYDGQTITYYAELTDRVNQTDTSKTITLSVDMTLPVINSINYTINRNRAEMIINITELNFDEVTYINHDVSLPREKRLCSRLNNDLCKGKITLNNNLATNSVDIMVYDEAGNAIAENVVISLV